MKNYGQNNENMVLKKNDFISWKINWEDKAKNIKAMLNQLNLSPEHYPPTSVKLSLEV